MNAMPPIYCGFDVERAGNCVRTDVVFLSNRSSRSSAFFGGGRMVEGRGGERVEGRGVCQGHWFGVSIAVVH